MQDLFHVIRYGLAVKSRAAFGCQSTQKEQFSQMLQQNSFDYVI